MGMLMGGSKPGPSPGFRRMWLTSFRSRGRNYGLHLWLAEGGPHLQEKALLMTRRCGYNLSVWCRISRRHEAARKVYGGVGGNFCVGFLFPHSFALLLTVAKPVSLWALEVSFGQKPRQRRHKRGEEPNLPSFTRDDIRRRGQRKVHDGVGSKSARWQGRCTCSKTESFRRRE
jgi:hypothetical protein